MGLDVDVLAVSGEWIRHAPHRSALLGRPVEPVDGRWQRGEVVGALYLADEAGTAIAEWYRYLAERGLPPGQAIPHDRHIWRVELEAADLRDAEGLQRVGLELPLPTRRTWSSFQAVGERLWREGAAALIAPSAARPQHHVLVVFADAWPPPGCTPIRAVQVSKVPAPPTGMTT